MCCFYLALSKGLNGVIFNDSVPLTFIDLYLQLCNRQHFERDARIDEIRAENEYREQTLNSFIKKVKFIIRRFYALILW